MLQIYKIVKVYMPNLNFFSPLKRKTLDIIFIISIVDYNSFDIKQKQVDNVTITMSWHS